MMEKGILGNGEFYLGSTERSLNPLNHSTEGAGSPSTVNVMKPFSPSLTACLSAGFTNLGLGPPLATRGVLGVFSQSYQFALFTNHSLSEGVKKCLGP